MKVIVALFLLLIPSISLAQQQRPMTQAELSGALNAAIEQGNAARALHMQAEAKAATLASDLGKAQAELAQAQAKIKELENPPEAKQ